jgi:2-isopropylmalate synthase
MNRGSVSVEIFDTTLRDGAQALPASNQFPDGSKVEIADQIAALGVNVIEAGFPRTKGDAEEVAEVAKDVGNSLYVVRSWTSGNEAEERQLFTPVIAGLSRTTPEDIDASWGAVQYARRARIHTFVSTDPEHMAKKFPGKTPEQVMEMGRKAVRYARNLTDSHPDATTEFSLEAASTTELVYAERVVKSAIDEGADIINMPDTVGERTPFWMRKFYGRVLGWVMETNPDVVVSAHPHNDLGNAVANTWALVDAAAEAALEYDRHIKVQLETTFCGVGERAGNADVFPVLAHLFKFSPELNVDVLWQSNPELSVAVANNVMAFAGLEVDRQNPIVGSDINAHRSGIHSDGVIKGGYKIYTPFDPQFWGHAESARHEDGKYQGRRGREASGAA